MSWIQRREVAALASALGVAVVVLLLRSAGLLMPLELSFFDRIVRATQEGPERDPRVALVLVTERDIQETGEWPISDLRLAAMLDAIERAGARVVGVDIYRDVPVPPGHDELNEKLLAMPGAIFITQFPSPGARGVPPPPVLANSDQIGFNNVVLDPDGVSRRITLFMDDEHGGVGYSFPLMIALIDLGYENIHPVPDPEQPELMRLGASTLEKLDANFGGYVAIDSGGYQIPLDLRRAPAGYDSITLTQLLEDPQRAEQVLRDRAVLVGVAAESVRDPFRIPLGAGEVSTIPGVELHAHMTAQLLRQALGESRMLGATPDWLEVASILVLAAMGGAASIWLRSGPMLAFGATSVLVLLWMVGVRGMQAAIWIPIVAPGLAWSGSLATATAYLSRRERHERSQLMQLFSRHVSPEIADEVWEHRDEFLEGGRRPHRQRLIATTFFADLVDFTSRSEAMDPEELIDWLEEFLEVLARAVMQNGGLVEDYFGDGMMACFGVPLPSETPEAIAEHARSAVRAGMDIHDAIQDANLSWRQRGFPEAQVRVGISTGSVVAGSLGINTRAKFCIVGESVVTSQRIQSLQSDETSFQTGPCRILVDAETHKHLDGSFETEHFGSFALKGKREPVTVFRVRFVGEPPRPERGKE